MARILFTDGIGAAVLHNGKPAPGNRFANWRPSAMPVGDDGFRQSDGLKTKFRYRDDFGATFDLTQIPTARQKTNLIEVNGDVTGTLGALPTGFTAPPSPNTMTAVLVGSPNNRPGDIGYNGTMGLHARDTSQVDNGVGYYGLAVTTGHHLTGSVWVYIPSTVTLNDLQLAFENNVTAAVTAHADMTKRDQWQLLTATATATATATTVLTLRMGSSAVTGTFVYSDAWSITDADDGQFTRMVDVAERLAYWLEDGNACQIETGDYDGNLYTMCGVLPGATIQPPTLSDKKNLEYTLSLAVVNLVNSPARMRCHYA